MRWPRVLRPATSADLPFIVDSWMNAYLERTASHPHGQEPLCRIEPRLYFEQQRLELGRLLDRSVSLVAHSPEHPDHILGWACGEPGLLHFCYVAKFYRMDGIATELLTELLGSASGFEFTFHTRFMVKLRAKWNCRYNPYRR